VFALSALERLLRTEEESVGEKKGGKVREREGGIARACLTTVATFSTAPMADGAVVVQAEAWGPSDVSAVTL